MELLNIKVDIKHLQDGTVDIEVKGLPLDKIASLHNLPEMVGEQFKKMLIARGTLEENAEKLKHVMMGDYQEWRETSQESHDAAPST